MRLKQVLSAKDNATRFGIWILILLLPMQGFSIEVQACGRSGSSSCCDNHECCCGVKQKQPHACGCHRSKPVSTSCCHGDTTADSVCQCGIGCPCGKGRPANPPVVPSRDSDSRGDVHSWAFAVNAFALAVDIKCPQQRVQLQTETIQSLSVDRCSTLCRYML